MPASGFRARRAINALLALVVSASVIGCVSHPVGPARTFSKYEGKAVTTAEGALSSVETARLAVQVGASGKTFGGYLPVVISEQEDAIAGVQGTFGSIQPPDARGDALRADLNQLLSDALDHVATVRLAVRRGERTSLAEIAAPLAGDVDALQAFIEEHG